MNKILFTFPGQGAQIPGMLHELDRQGEHRTLLDQASDILGEDVMTLDTPQALERTRAVQLCILIAGVASASWLIAKKAVPDFVSGLSIGAFPAAVVSGALDFADALRLVSLRGELMEKAAPAGCRRSPMPFARRHPLSISPISTHPTSSSSPVPTMP